MNNKIDIVLSNSREIECSTSIIGKTYENEATILKFLLTEEMITKYFYIEFEKPDGTKLVTPKLEVKLDDSEIIETHGTVEYVIPNSLLDLKGELKLEIVLRNSDEMVWKSYALKFDILEAINATETIPEQYPDFVSEAQRVMDLIETDGEGNLYLSDDGTYKEVQGGTGDYNFLENKPSINNIELSNNKTLDELGIQAKGDYLMEETDPTIASYIKSIKETDIANWNNKSDFSGSYNDLTDKPAIPEPYTLPTASVDSLGGVKVGTNLSVDENGVLSVTGDLGVTDYDNLTNKPVTNIINQTETVIIRSLESGQYIFQGKFKPYEGATSTYSFSAPCFVNLIKTTSKTSMQLFYPASNRVQFFEITDTDATYQNIYLSNLATTDYVDDSITALTIPTKTSELTNDSGYQTEDEVDTLISNAIGGALNGTY